MEDRHKLFVEVEFPRLLSDRGQQDVKQAVQEFKEAVEHLEARVIRADLLRQAAGPPPRP